MTASSSSRLTLGRMQNPVRGLLNGSAAAAQHPAPLRRVPTMSFPTIAEAGVPGYECSTWHGWFAPGGTSSAIVSKLSAELANSVKSPDVQARLQPDGAEGIGSSPEQLKQFVVNDIGRWRKVVAAAGIRFDCDDERW